MSNFEPRTKKMKTLITHIIIPYILVLIIGLAATYAIAQAVPEEDIAGWEIY